MPAKANAQSVHNRLAQFPQRKRLHHEAFFFRPHCSDALRRQLPGASPVSFLKAR